MFTYVKSCEIPIVEIFDRRREIRIHILNARINQTRKHFHRHSTFFATTREKKNILISHLGSK